MCLVLAWPILHVACPARAMQVQVVEAGHRPGESAAADPLAIDEEAEEVVVRQMQPAFVLSDDQFDQWVFGAPRNSGGGRNKLDTLLTLQVEDVARVCRLTEIQKKKLQLAGHGDIKRFFEKVDEKRKKFEKVKTDQNKVSEIYQELLPLRSTLQSGLFNEGSFYSKTLRTVLTDEDAVTYQKLVHQKKPLSLSCQDRARRGPARSVRRLSIRRNGESSSS